MIPTIETICEDLKAGKITVQQAVKWLHMHAEGAANELRDCFAAAALPAYIAAQMEAAARGKSHADSVVAGDAYLMADAMLEAREPQGERSDG